MVNFMVQELVTQLVGIGRYEERLVEWSTNAQIARSQ